MNQGKSLRNFQCRDTLWDLFERMSKELDCSMDYLINEALRQYAEMRRFPQADVETESTEETANIPKAAVDAIPTEPVKPPPLPPRRSSIPPPPPAEATAPPKLLVPKPGAKPIATGRPSTDPLPRPTVPRPSASESSGGIGMKTAGSSSASERPRLTLIFQGRKIPVVQDQFIIGRTSKSTDLTIKDTNISRQHAAVIFHNDQYYIKDLGSTNGIEFQSKRIDSKKINEGDVFYLCNYELHFTYES